MHQWGDPKFRELMQLQVDEADCGTSIRYNKSEYALLSLQHLLVKKLMR